jgi:large subunit ribosomal protein L35
MSKLKTRKAALKRYKKTANNKFLRRRGFKAHILTKKSSKRKRGLSKSMTIKKVDVAHIKKMLLI